MIGGKERSGNNNMNEEKEYKKGVTITESSVILYHITKKSNLESILTKGLIPNRGHQRKHCMLKEERESPELWISFCRESEIESWREVLYGKRNIPTVVLCVKVPRPVKCKQWGNGWEYGYFEGKINPENIIEISNNTNKDEK